MLLGKRQRPPMKRTTSMTEFTLDLNHTTTTTVVDNNIINPPVSVDAAKLDHRLLSATKIHRRNSADFIETAHFLRAYHLCKRRLIPGRDIFMYRFLGLSVVLRLLSAALRLDSVSKSVSSRSIAVYFDGDHSTTWAVFLQLPADRQDDLLCDGVYGLVCQDNLNPVKQSSALDL